jgi:DNA-directed RNA polymerase beta' subunit
MVVDTIPVMPPKFRPVIELPGTGDISVSDVNEHYRSTILMNNQIKALKGKKGLQKQRDKVRKSLFDGFSGSMGMSMGLVQDENVKGLAETVAGTNPKSGYFQKRLLKRRQDTSGTAVVGPDPDLDMDQIGVPEQMAWKIFKPHIKRELRGQGLTPLQAEQEIEDRTKLGNDALQRAMGDRHVMANRAPTLHKFSIMAFKPKLIPGHAVKLPVEVLGGFNADFDGDTFGIHVPATEEANKEAEDLLPSKNMYLPGRNREEMNPGLSHEYVLGLFKITRKGAA